MNKLPKNKAITTEERANDGAAQDAMTLSGRIQIQMAVAGIRTKAELARKLSAKGGKPVTRQTVTKWLNGDVHALTPIQLFRLADVLKCNARWLGIHEGPPQKAVVLTVERTEVISLYDALIEAKMGRTWMKQGYALLEDHGQTSPTQPYKPGEKSPTR